MTYLIFITERWIGFIGNKFKEEAVQGVQD